MKTLANLKKDLDFNKGLSSLIEVLKNIAVSQYHTLEGKMKTFEKFPASISTFFEFIDLNIVKHQFLQPQANTQAVVAVTSDSGLLGGLNMQVVNASLRELEKIPGKLIVVGERGKNYARESGVPFVAFPGVKDESRMEQAIQMRDYLMKEAMFGSFSHLKVVFPRPVSFTVQHVDIVTFLPFAGIATQEHYPEVITESKIEDLVEYLIFLWMGHKLFEIFGLSRLAEFAARYVHLEESLHKLKDMDGKLRLEYFRVRHELIDRNMRELFSARSIYAGR